MYDSCALDNVRKNPTMVMAMQVDEKSVEWKLPTPVSSR